MSAIFGMFFAIFKPLKISDFTLNTIYPHKGDKSYCG